MPRLRLEGKVAIITGAASGIGEAAARLFTSNGARAVIADIQDELGSEVAASIGRDKCSYKHCDVTDEKQIEETINYALATYGTLHIMYCNAGVLGLKSGSGILDLDPASFDRIMAVNVKGTAMSIKHTVRAMTVRGAHGSIVCTASVASCRGTPAAVAYCASKHAVLGLARAAAGELGRYGIRVNCVSPDSLATPLLCEFMGQSAEEFEATANERSNLTGVALKTSHVAEAALFLASDESGYVSGHNLAVDGRNTVVLIR